MGFVLIALGHKVKLMKSIHGVQFAWRLHAPCHGWPGEACYIGQDRPGERALAMEYNIHSLNVEQP